MTLCHSLNRILEWVERAYLNVQKTIVKKLLPSFAALVDEKFYHIVFFFDTF